MGSHQDVAAVATILNKITRKEKFRFYRKSGVFDLHGHKS